ncbi:uncharacterized protein BP01DRAFT_361227 [Aspergillus saccharolyticus JOP 1030-1]|uniref:Uncharacterized protein n=1 Tax=Aspergillus saccharolyticus JOP 1030-1 TaxID=1450539 RepID=A0A318ZYQ0_9EURO|nr:hypothetical protein BP01DRAFT_361227 [Aspergillus saccharolyticus JOP 1030-1]PYH40502.1 hypothetical protein BP01DRAFT_361227 [Aspergillus saccharolyticus JOP 1030-1]
MPIKCICARFLVSRDPHPPAKLERRARPEPKGRRQRPPTLARDSTEELRHKARNTTRAHLRELHRRVQASPSAAFSDSDARELGIECVELPLQPDGLLPNTGEAVYFQPWPMRRLEAHPVDMTDPTTRDSARVKEKLWARLDRKRADQDGFLSAVFADEFLEYLRVGPLGRDTLEQFSLWTEGNLENGIIRSRYMNFSSSADPDAGPVAASTADFKFEEVWCAGREHPHISLIVTHKVAPAEKLLRTEVLALVGIMRTRLSRAALKEHTIIPINMISCMRQRKARILQAHFDGEDLVIRKSGLYNFATRELREKNIPLFLLYMASRPTGNTKAYKRRIREV